MIMLFVLHETIWQHCLCQALPPPAPLYGNGDRHVDGADEEERVGRVEELREEADVEVGGQAEGPAEGLHDGQQQVHRVHHRHGDLEGKREVGGRAGEKKVARNRKKSQNYVALFFFLWGGDGVHYRHGQLEGGQQNAGWVAGRKVARNWKEKVAKLSFFFL